MSLNVGKPATLKSAVRSQREPMGAAFSRCPICDSTYLEYELIVDKSPICGCQDCGLLFLNPQPPIDAGSENVSASQPGTSAEVYEANAAERIRELISYPGLAGGTLLVIGATTHLCNEARRPASRSRPFPHDNLNPPPNWSCPQEFRHAFLFPR